MVRRRLLRSKRTAIVLAVAAAVGLLTGCSFFAAHPFPDYVAGIEKKIDISSQIAAVLKTAVSARYEIGTVATPSGDRVLVLVDPAVAQPTASSPTQALLMFSRTLDFLGTVNPQGSLSYFGRPFVFAADGRILSGDSVFDLTTGSFYLSYPPTGLTGFGFSVTSPTPRTYLLSLPAGETSSTQLVLEYYDNLWTLPPSNFTVPIVSPSAGTSTSYVLEGARLESDADTITIALRDTATNELTVVHASLAAEVAGTAPPLLPAASGTPTIDGTDSKVYFTANDIILRRTSGLFERYTADGSKMTASITSDRRTGIVYGFSPDGTYLYRLDPATGSFALIRTWW